MILWLRAKTKHLFFLLFSLAVLSACKKVDNEVIGEDILPSGDNINLIQADTFSLLTYTVKDDSIRTDERSVCPLGAMNDPVFGKTSTNLYAQLRLPENNLDFSAVTIDSLVLSLKYSGKTLYCGNTSTTQTFRVYQLSQSMSLDSQYFSTSSVAYEPAVIGSWTGSLNLNDSIPIQQGTKIRKVPPQLRIPITNTAYIDKFRNAGTNFATTELFLQYIKGLAVVSQTNNFAPGEGAIVSLDFFTGYSGLTIYYNDSLSKFFPINENSARFNAHQHDYSGTVLAQQLGLKQNRDTCYAQSMAGVKTLIKFPTVFDLVKKNNNKPVTILNAELIIPTYALSSTTDYAFPLQTMFILADSLEKNKSAFGVVPFGAYNADKSQIKTSFTYSLLPKNYFQTILDEYRQTGKATDYGIFLVTSYNYAGMERIILNTAKTGVIRPKLRLIYTVVP